MRCEAGRGGGRVIHQLKENITTFLEILKTNYKNIVWKLIWRLKVLI